MNVIPTAPLTTVIICKNVPLDNTYSDTITFTSLAAQESYFKGKAKFTFPNLGPVRMQNQIRIPKNADMLFDCNYIMFQNANFSNKWFYAFITAIDFDNVNMSRLSIEIDVMQTWYFDYTVKPSFVQREHINVDEDTIGANLVPENLELGEYVMKDFHGTELLTSNWKIVVATPRKYEDMLLQWGGLYGGIYSGLYFNVFDATDTLNVNAFLDALSTAGYIDEVVSIFMCPEACVQEMGTGKARELYVGIVKNFDSLDEYIPRNQKLFTYPYNFLYVTNNEGNSASFHYEYFGDPTNPNCDFQMACAFSANPEVILYPKYYKGVEFNYNEKLAINGFPQCAFLADSYKAWLAQNASSMNVGMMASAVAAVGGVATGNVAVAAGGLMGIAGSMAKVQDHAAQPRQTHGQSVSSAVFSDYIKDFFFSHMTIRHEFAQRIDEFFDMFGYATNRVKVPNITGRPSWNYVKTMDVKIVGSVPFNDMAKIKENYNNGITFWHGDFVGDYTRNNR